jgi:hypothetical protein
MVQAQGERASGIEQVLSKSANGGQQDAPSPHFSS